MRFVLPALAVACLLALSAQPGQAQDLASMHSKVRVGGKLCFADHSHSGSSSGQRSRKAAELEAIRSWQDFTAWEYGRTWGSYSLAVGKSMSCSAGGSWSCSVEARPCRGGR